MFISIEQWKVLQCERKEGEKMTDYSTNAERKCVCQKWAENTKKIVSLQQWALTHGWRVDIEPFNFCPYCGNELTKTQEKESISY